jgi:anti-sigma factor RsiW
VSPCTVNRDELAEVALGTPASEGLFIHLQQCCACATELERQRALARRMDVAVKALVCSQPPRQLLASITARVRSERPWPWSRAWPGGAVGAVFAVSLVALILGLRTMQPQATSGSSAAALTAWRSPTGALLQTRGSVLETPFHDVWFDVGPPRSRPQPMPGGTV